MAFGVLENGLSVGRITSQRMDRQKSGEMLFFSPLFVFFSFLSLIRVIPTMSCQVSCLLLSLRRDVFILCFLFRFFCAIVWMLLVRPGAQRVDVLCTTRIMTEACHRSTGTLP